VVPARPEELTELTTKIYRIVLTGRSPECSVTIAGDQTQVIGNDSSPAGSPNSAATERPSNLRPRWVGVGLGRLDALPLQLDSRVLDRGGRFAAGRRTSHTQLSI